MTHFAVNWLAVVVAMIVSMGIGAAWYMGLARQWMAALGKTREELGGSSATPFIIGAACELVMAYFIALLTPTLFGSITVWNGILTGAHMWLGFVITVMILNHRYQNAKWSLTLIDGGHLLAVLVAQGLIIGLFG